MNGHHRGRHHTDTALPLWLWVAFFTHGNELVRVHKYVQPDSTGRDGERERLREMERENERNSERRRPRESN
jgi:hypothetical protein